MICAPRNIERAAALLHRFNRPAAVAYGEEGGWRQLCGRADIDLVYICTDWLTHTDIAVYAMQQGRHAALEVPAAMSVADCWRLVDTAEQTRRHCMMLENCCYDAFCLDDPEHGAARGIGRDNPCRRSIYP